MSEQSFSRRFLRKENDADLPNLSRLKCHLLSNIFLLENALNDNSDRSKPQTVGHDLLLKGILASFHAKVSRECRVGSREA